MPTNNALLCIHRQPSELDLLEESGYELVTATNGHEGLQLFMSRSVDAIVIEYHLGLVDGSVIASAIKQMKPDLPIVLLADSMELPSEAFQFVDAFVTKSDGPQFLLATVNCVLNVKPLQRRQRDARRSSRPNRADRMQA